MKKIAIEIIMFISGIIFLVTAFRIKAGGFSGDVLNQRNYVLILVGLLLILSAISIVRTLLWERNKKADKVKKTVQETEQVVESAENKSNKPVNKNIYITIGLILLFIIGFTHIGFYVSSFVFVFAMTWMMFNWKRNLWIRSLIFSLALNGTFFILFQFINVYFPDNTLLF
ncbi:tripartite tricarboxylate transporter TctB family protein [Gracilibacillus salitolerans]|nr:tripartite tricarboxylate transporter TctB family protein [Gracilibacillus salitolerans]